MARERLVRSNLRCGPVSFVLFFLLVMSDVPEEEAMARYWYRKEKETEAGLGCVRLTEMKGMMSFLESKSYSLPTYL